MSFVKLTDLEESIGKAIVNAAFKVHKELGPGLLEKVYEICLAHELRKSGLLVARQIDYLFNMMEYNSMKALGWIF